mmetsp:Transcript_40566/g.126550  ORF Transcript_40566/g.126550 Transcript_40566/m.126550 type:complete len:270 (+) Transcript_40566:587-1396(+)
MRWAAAGPWSPSPETRTISTASSARRKEGCRSPIAQKTCETVTASRAGKSEATWPLPAATTAAASASGRGRPSRDSAPAAAAAAPSLPRAAAAAALRVKGALRRAAPTPPCSAASAATCPACDEAGTSACVASTPALNSTSCWKSECRSAWSGRSTINSARRAAAAAAPISSWAEANISRTWRTYPRVASAAACAPLALAVASRKQADCRLNSSRRSAPIVDSSSVRKQRLRSRYSCSSSCAAESSPTRLMLPSADVNNWTCVLEAEEV